eukprot:m.38033 g.38033  ORF g.38033 m.38033 type:complete len:298 (+) comp9911_c0_seq1:173-1066(+)
MRLNPQPYVLRLDILQSSEEAVALYKFAEQPHTTTKAAVLRASGVDINESLPFRTAGKSMFFLAFERSVPRVLKISEGHASAQEECRMFDEVARLAPASQVFLVPVRHLALRGEHTVHDSTDSPAQSTLLTGGLLMPFYPCTLADWGYALVSRKPKIELLETDITFVCEPVTVSRMASTLQFLHAQGWLHGDVKPSNIFLDNEGKGWLGDYGSSWFIAKPRTDLTGTPAFTCEGIPATRGGVFDMVGLVISMLSVLGFLDLGAAASTGWKLAEVTTALRRVTCERIKHALAPLLPPE